MTHAELQISWKRADFSISGSLKQSDIHIKKKKKKERNHTQHYTQTSLVGGLLPNCERQNHKYFIKQYRE